MSAQQYTNVMDVRTMLSRSTKVACLLRYKHVPFDNPDSAIFCWGFFFLKNKDSQTCQTIKLSCTTIHRYPIFSMRYSVMCKVYTDYCGTSEIEHGLCACAADNPHAKARGLSLRTGTQTMLYLSHVFLSKSKTYTNLIFLTVYTHLTGCLQHTRAIDLIVAHKGNKDAYCSPQKT